MKEKGHIIVVVSVVVLGSMLLGALLGGVLPGQRAPEASSRPKVQELAESQPAPTESRIDSVALLQQAGAVAQEVSDAVQVTEIEYIQADESFEVEVLLADGSEVKVFLDRQFEVIAQDGEWRGGSRSITADVLDKAAAAALAHAGGGRVVGIEASEELGAYEVDIMLGGALVEIYLDDAFAVLAQR